MPGQDMSKNLGGMLSQIGSTVASGAEAFNPVLMAATKPRGDMNDPAHLENLARWASQNGDSAAASTYMNQANRLATKATADAKQLRAEEGSVAMGRIQQGMNSVLASDAPQEVKDQRMAALEEAAVGQAGRYGMDAQAAAQMGGQARDQQVRRDVAQNNQTLIQKSVDTAEAQQTLEEAYASGDEKKLAGAKKKLEAKGLGSAVRGFDKALADYEVAVSAANDAVRETGPLSEAEATKAKDHNISGDVPRLVRQQLRQIEVAEATRVRTAATTKAPSKAVLEGMMPQILASMESNNNFWDTDMDNFIDDALEDEDVIEAIASYVEAGGSVDKGPEMLNQVKKAVLSYANSIQGVDTADEVSALTGSSTVTTKDGETVTIKRKK